MGKIVGYNGRQNKILDLLKEQEQISIKGLSRHFGVSEMTIRRDFDVLEKEGLLIKTPGGGANSQRISFDLILGRKVQVEAEAKKAIARKAAAHITSDDAVLLDTGTTVFQMTNSLGDVKNLTVTTPSLAVAANLFWNKNVRVIVLGGHVKPWSPDLVGPIAEQIIRSMKFRKAFLGADGIDPEHGFFCSDINSANVIREIIESSEEVYVLCDSSKIGSTALTKYADFPAIDCLITDNRDPRKIKLLEKKVSVEIAELKKPSARRR